MLKEVDELDDVAMQDSEEVLVLSGELALILRDDAVEASSDELEAAVGEVAKVLEKDVVVLGGKVVPVEDCILRLGPHREQIVAPDFGRDARLHGVVAEHANTVAL